MIVGMDFGTTNSGMAVYNGRSITVLPLDPSSPNPRVIRTALYITNEQDVYVGRTAVDRYYEQNLGRPVRTKKVWIGEFEVFGADMYFVTDAYAWIDVSSPGQLLLSIKTRLREHDHPGTIVGPFYYALEDLIAIYLTVTKTRAEKLLGQPVHEVVLGRPVRFSTDPQHDRLAQGRLLQAAFRAGYERVYLQPEPIAAAYSYETTLDQPQNVLVFDFGGGTLDLTIMRLGEPGQQRVLATGGVPIAGDVFDEMLVRAKLPKHFGEGSFYGPRHKALPVPSWIYDNFSSWRMMLDLQTTENRRMLRDIAQTAQRRHQIEALLGLVSSNYGLKMFDEVEQAKRLLSEKRGAEIRLDGPEFKVRDFVTRTEFESIIQGHIRTIDQHLRETVAASGLRPEQIDVVIRTGGSAQIPAFYELLCRHFGTDKVRTVDTFSSVTAGLGVIGYEVAEGKLALPAYTPADAAPPPQAQGSRPSVRSASLELVKLRVLMQENAAEATAVVPEIGIIFLGDGQTATAVALPAAQLNQTDPLSLSPWPIHPPIHQALATSLDEPLLIITSLYRFILITPRQLLELQTAGLTLTQLHHLKPDETICTLQHWPSIKRQEKLLLVTSLGLARAYPTQVMSESIEAPIPFQFENPLPGLPVAMVGANRGDEAVVVTQGGRGLRLALDGIGVRGVQAINCGATDRVTTAVIATPQNELLLVLADGYGRRLLAEWVEPIPRPNSKGKSLVARRSAVAGLVATGSNAPIWLVTESQLVVGSNGRLPLENVTKSYPLLRLPANAAVQSVLMVPSK